MPSLIFTNKVSWACLFGGKAAEGENQPTNMKIGAMDFLKRVWLTLIHRIRCVARKCTGRTAVGDKYFVFRQSEENWNNYEYFSLPSVAVRITEQLLEAILAHMQKQTWQTNLDWHITGGVLQLLWGIKRLDLDRKGNVDFLLVTDRKRDFSEVFSTMLSNTLVIGLDMIALIYFKMSRNVLDCMTQG